LEVFAIAACNGHSTAWLCEWNYVHDVVSPGGKRGSGAMKQGILKSWWIVKKKGIVFIFFNALDLPVDFFQLPVNCIQLCPGLCQGSVEFLVGKPAVVLEGFRGRRPFSAWHGPIKILESRGAVVIEEPHVGKCRVFDNFSSKNFNVGVPASVRVRGRFRHRGPVFEVGCHIVVEYRYL